MLEFLDEVMERPSTTGSIVRAFRKKFNLTQKDLEKITGISESHVSAIEHDKIDLGVKRAEMLAAVFGLHPSTLLYPNSKWEKSKEIIAIEKRAAKYLKIS
ncbi:helix-turn-helix domain-containing protein [bacterium]|nr:helix-turn-helix domain-containing protein [bacterium]